MKLNRWYILYALALAILPILLVIVTQFTAPAELLTPPSLVGTNLEIQKAFEKSIKDKAEIMLQYPTSGDYRSAFVLKDLDNDGSDEAIVYYTLKSDETVVRVNVLDQVDGQWTSLGDEPGYGAKVLSVSFTDLNGDGNIEILTNWSLFESTTAKTLTIHSLKSLDKNKVEFDALVNQSYTYETIADIDSDGLDEVFVTWLDTEGNNISRSYASLLKQAPDGTINQIGQNVLLDASVSAYDSLKLETYENTSTAFLDAHKGEDTMITEVIWWDEDEKSLVVPFLDHETLTNVKTARSPAVPSVDIDGDGQIEIPLNVARTGVTFPKETQLKLFSWNVPTDEGLEPTLYGFVNNTLGCFFSLPAEFENNILAYRLSDESVTTFYWADDGENRNNPLFTLVAKDINSISDVDSYTFKVVHNETVIYGTLTNIGEEVGFTNELIENSLIFFDDLK